MTDHRITPPPGLVGQWQDESPEMQIADHIQYLMTRAAQWGADQQLAKDAKWLDENSLNEPHLRITPSGECLRQAMRPKPLSLKEQALEALGRFSTNAHTTVYQMQNDFDLCRRALEALDD
jgi:hypothetical protein